MPLELLPTCEQSQAFTRAHRAAGATVALVPTMGALHEGHLGLVRDGRRRCDLVVVSIFVNPTQFGPGEDFERYPRALEQDLEKLAAEGVAAVFHPAPEEMYPPGHSTFVEPPAVAARWEGERRPGHFRGVCTVCLKLFHAVSADVAIFGAKDYQQAAVIRAMVRDVNLPMEVAVSPTVRESDGLAMSSRNAYLSADERRRAPAIYRGLAALAEAVQGGERDVAALEGRLAEALAAGVDRIDYAVVVDAGTLEPITTIARPALALVAAHVGGVRLIDNLPLPVDSKR